MSSITYMGRAVSGGGRGGGVLRRTFENFVFNILYNNAKLCKIL